MVGARDCLTHKIDHLSKNMSLSNLPLEAQGLIGRYVGLMDIESLMQTSRSLHQAIDIAQLYIDYYGQSKQI